MDFLGVPARPPNPIYRRLRHYYRIHVSSLREHTKQSYFPSNHTQTDDRGYTNCELLKLGWESGSMKSHARGILCHCHRYAEHTSRDPRLLLPTYRYYWKVVSWSRYLEAWKIGCFLPARLMIGLKPDSPHRHNRVASSPKLIL
jgi:hypothetical protein